MKTITISSKGQIVLPAEIRKKWNLNAGDKLVVSETENGLLINAKRSNKKKSINDLAGSVRTMKKLSIDEMNQLISEHFKNEYNEST